MSIVYIDTSIIIAKYKQQDEYHEFANQILNSDINTKIISHISLVELSSVLSRNKENIKFADVKGIELLSGKEKILFFLKYIISDSGLKLQNFTGMNEITSIIPQEQIFMDYHQAISISMRSNLRTLDNLHLATAQNIVSFKGIDLEYFLTGDHEILDNEELSDIIGIQIIHPKEYIKKFKIE